VVAHDGARLTPTAIVLLAGGFVLVYWQVIRALVNDWITDGNSSHGFLIVPIAIYFVWERRRTLAGLPLAPSLAGLVIFVCSIALLAAGLLGSEFFLSRVAMIGTLASMIVFLLGWAHLRVLAFPLAFLLLMIPLPAILFNQIAMPLQLLASQVGTVVIAWFGIPVLREGNIIVLAHRTLEVAEACSGIRSLVSLIAVALTCGCLADSRGWIRTLVTLSAVPVAIATNGARIAGTGIVAQWLGDQAGEEFFHDFSGWALFVAAVAIIVLVQRGLVRTSARRDLAPIAETQVSRARAY
jgi:exosortase